MSNFYKIYEINHTRFFKVPKELFENSEYNKKLNSDAKLLYAILLDRMELSRTNNWVNKNDEIYLIYTREDMQEMLGVSDKTVTKAIKQLTKMELVYEVRQGLGKPNIIYIGKIKYAETIETSQIRRNYDSRNGDFTIQETEILRPNDTNINETNLNETNDNENGILSIDRNSAPPFVNQDITRAIKEYMHDLYPQRTNSKHPFLKPAQYRAVYMQISSVCDEWELGHDHLIDMMLQFLNSDIDTDYNIIHFATEGILLNRMFEVAY